MSVTVETLENLERKVVLSLPWSKINAETEKKLKQTQRRAKIDGFRPGKAPFKNDCPNVRRKRSKTTLSTNWYNANSTKLPLLKN